MSTVFILVFFLLIGKKNQSSPSAKSAKKSESRPSAKLYSREIFNFCGCGNPAKFNLIKVS